MQSGLVHCAMHVNFCIIGQSGEENRLFTNGSIGKNMDIVQILFVGGIYLALAVLWASFGPTKRSLRIIVEASSDSVQSLPRISTPKVGSKKKESTKEHLVRDSIGWMCI